MADTAVFPFYDVLLPSFIRLRLPEIAAVQVSIRPRKSPLRDPLAKPAIGNLLIFKNLPCEYEHDALSRLARYVPSFLVCMARGIYISAYSGRFPDTISRN